MHKFTTKFHILLNLGLCDEDMQFYCMLKL